jgi:RNA polymerase sigma factor (sigma-70 family)
VDHESARLGAVDSGFELFYRERWPKAVGLAALLLGSRSGAQDVAHDCFVEIDRRWASIHRPDVYLATILRRRCQALRVADRRFAPLGAHLDREVARDEIEARLDVLEALRQLSQPHREVVVLRFYADLSEADMASVLDVRVGTVKSRLSRALTAMQKEMTA